MTIKNRQHQLRYCLFPVLVHIVTQLCTALCHILFQLGCLHLFDQVSCITVSGYEAFISGIYVPVDLYLGIISCILDTSDNIIKGLPVLLHRNSLLMSLDPNQPSATGATVMFGMFHNDTFLLPMDFPAASLAIQKIPAFGYRPVILNTLLLKRRFDLDLILRQQLINSICQLLPFSSVGKNTPAPYE